MKSVRREQTGWYFYDWANSAFATVVLSAVTPGSGVPPAATSRRPPGSTPR